MIWRIIKLRVVVVTLLASCQAASPNPYIDYFPITTPCNYCFHLVPQIFPQMHFWGLGWRSGPFLTHKLLSRQDSTALLTHTHTNMTDCGTWIVDSNWSLTCFWQGVCSLFNQNQHAYTSPDLRGHTFSFSFCFFFFVPLSLSLSLSLFRPYIQSAHWCLFLFISPLTRG